jgi:hypothetical protein
MPTLDLLAAWVPILAEPGDDITIPITVPSGSESGTWTASIWRNKLKDDLVESFTVSVSGTIVTISLSDTETAALVPTGTAAFAGYWELDHTASGSTRTWLKGDFVLDPSRRSGNGGQGLVVVINEGAVVAVPTAGGGGGAGGDADTLGGLSASAFVQTTGAQAVAGVKTFASTPVVPDGSWALAKLADVSTGRLLGRSASGTGDVEELTATEAKAVLAIAAGDVSGLGALATLSTVGSAQITDGSIVNADIGASAGLALSKLASVADDRLLGNVSGSSAPATALTAVQVEQFLAAATPWVFNVKHYGALGDNSTDDMAAINATVAAAWAYAIASENCYAEVHFPDGVYILAGATTKAGPTLGNAQIPIPVRAGTDRKVTLAFVGPRGACRRCRTGIRPSPSAKGRCSNRPSPVRPWTEPAAHRASSADQPPSTATAARRRRSTTSTS